MKTQHFLKTLIVALAMIVAQPVFADWHGGGHEDRGNHRGSYHRDYNRDYYRGRGHGYRPASNQWRGGHWSHRAYNGQMGWWWVIGNQPFFYQAPVYPYPRYPY
jgi:hypothetical protein